MKYIYLVLLLLISSIGFSQTKGITYQAVILNPVENDLPGVNQTNAPLANTDVCLKFGILDQNSDIEYLETIQTTTDKFGMVNLIIGTGSQIGGYASTFSDVVWGNNAKNLQVNLNAKGDCSSYTEISNQPFTYVPFALNALNENKKLIDVAVNMINLALKLEQEGDFRSAMQVYKVLIKSYPKSLEASASRIKVVDLTEGLKGYK